MQNNLMVKKNEDYIIEITGQTHEGMGVGKIDGFTVFVEGAIFGEKVKVKIVKVLKNYSYGKLLEIIAPATYRANPPCPVVKRCGGCQLQHMSYEGQLKYKTQLVKDAVERIGGLKDIIVHETIGMEEPWYYRNKAQFPVGMNKDEIHIGFYAGRSHEIIDTDKCLIQDKGNDEALDVFKDFIINYKISIYDENTGKGLIRHIMTRKGFKTGEVMICIVINGDDLPYAEKLVEVFRQRIKGLQTVVLNINKKNTNIIMGDKNKIIYGEGFIYDFIGEFKFKISPHSFFQVNPVQTEVLYNRALEYAGLTGKEIVIDAYCGIGTISLFLSKKAKKVYGVEIVGQAIEDARANAKLNGISNVEFILGESETVIPRLYEEGIRADVIVVDPPRKGCDEKLLEIIAKMAPKRMVYVSCNPSTMARDLKYLTEKGYEVKEVQPVDQFPQTVHVETVALMSRIEN